METLQFTILGRIPQNLLLKAKIWMENIAILFGSCNDVNKTQLLWPAIERRVKNDTYWLWGIYLFSMLLIVLAGGDNIYADSRPTISELIINDPFRIFRNSNDFSRCTFCKKSL